MFSLTERKMQLVSMHRLIGVVRSKQFAYTAIWSFGTAIFAIGVTTHVMTTTFRKEAHSPPTISIGRVPSQAAFPPQRVPALPSGVKHALGDRLKVTFFERIRMGAEESADTGTAFSELVERTELTGEYVVQQDGSIILPLLGSVDVEGKSGGGVRNLEEAFRQAFGGDAKVSVVTTEREPVYVIGPTGRSGAFKFTPGMTVIHAVAISGAGEGDRADLYLRTEHIRAVERHEQCRQKLKRLLPKAVILRAEVAGELAETPHALIELVGSNEANVLMDQARRIRALTLASRQSQVEALQAAVATARRDDIGLKGKLIIVERQISAHEQRRKIISGLREKGSGSSHAYYQSEADLAQAEERKPEIMVALSASQLRIEQAQQSLAKMKVDARAELEREIVALESDIQEQYVAMGASQRLISDFKLASFRLESGNGNVSFGIVRRSREGTRIIPASETTELVPGDLVRVSSIRSHEPTP